MWQCLISRSKYSAFAWDLKDLHTKYCWPSAEGNCQILLERLLIACVSINLFWQVSTDHCISYECKSICNKMEDIHYSEPCTTALTTTVPGKRFSRGYSENDCHGCCLHDCPRDHCYAMHWVVLVLVILATLLDRINFIFVNCYHIYKYYLFHIYTILYCYQPCWIIHDGFLSCQHI